MKTCVCVCVRARACHVCHAFSSLSYVLQLSISNALFFVHASAGRKPRSCRKLEDRPSTSFVYRGTVSDSDSYFDSHKASSTSFDDSHHSHGSLTPVGLEVKGMVNFMHPLSIHGQCNLDADHASISSFM